MLSASGWTNVATRKTTTANTGKCCLTSWSQAEFWVSFLAFVLIPPTLTLLCHTAPGGNIIVDRESDRTDFCVFRYDGDDPETIRGFAQVLLKLVRRYKYLEKTLEEEFKKIIKFLKGFTAEERDRLAKLTAILITNGLVSVSALTSAIHDQSVKDGHSGDFLVTTLRTWLLDRDSTTIWSSIRKASIDQKILDFFPANKRTPEHLESVFRANGLHQLLEFQKAGLGDKAKKELHSQVVAMIKEEASVKEIESFVKEAVAKNSMSEHEVAVLLWNTLMNGVEWNKKEELVAEQALKHLKVYAPLLEKFTTTVKAEIALMNRVQEFSYDNMIFLKVFSKIIQLFYKSESDTFVHHVLNYNLASVDVLSEDAILKWYKEAHSAKGKSVFLDQTRQFVEWLQSADEGEHLAFYPIV